jgi:hypothetical protein
MVREMLEEIGAAPAMETVRKAATVLFHARGEPYYEMHCFLIRELVGDPRPTITMTAVRWFRLADLPLAQMLEADVHLFSRYFGPPFRAYVYYERPAQGLILPIEYLPP